MPEQEPIKITVPDWADKPDVAAASRVMGEKPNPWSKEAHDQRVAERMDPVVRAEVVDDVADEALEATGIDDPEDIDNMKFYPKNFRHTHSPLAVPGYRSAAQVDMHTSPSIEPENEQTQMINVADLRRQQREAQAAQDALEQQAVNSPDQPVIPDLEAQMNGEQQMEADPFDLLTKSVQDEVLVYNRMLSDKREAEHDQRYADVADYKRALYSRSQSMSAQAKAFLGI